MCKIKNTLNEINELGISKLGDIALQLKLSKVKQHKMIRKKINIASMCEAISS